uniref:ATP synthase F0 subunit 8 n=1 Tax=Hemidactylus almakhwah TaxID=2897831 RepID=UPI0021B6AB16|nr:ATP synthase F0 subunit 8 [Hemidactylus almakhwah]UVW80890.1 ATP synthase F0 subunit 8 [Hemidactylus almakhwah]
MPQLYPAPWFMTLLTAWLIIMLIMKPTLMHLDHTAPPAHQPDPHPETTWLWTWH